MLRWLLSFVVVFFLELVEHLIIAGDELEYLLTQIIVFEKVAVISSALIDSYNSLVHFLPLILLHKAHGRGIFNAKYFLGFAVDTLEGRAVTIFEGAGARVQRHIRLHGVFEINLVQINKLQLW